MTAIPVPITALPPASTPLTGTEFIPLVQGGATKSTPIFNALGYTRTSAETSAGITPTNYLYPPGDVRRYGAAQNAPDNSSAFAQACLSGSTVVYFASGTWPFTAGIVVPGGIELRGDAGLNPTTPGPVANGTVLSFSNGVSTCITVNNDVSNASSSLRNFAITRAGGAPPSGSIGIQIYGGYNIEITCVWTDNHAIPLSFKADHGGSLGYGISAQIDNLNTSRASDVHLQIDTWPEIRIINSRFGTNGPLDYSCNGYIRITGGSTTNPAGGPNTIYIVNTQFNQGQNSAAYWIRLENQSVASISDVGDYSFANVHVETIGSGYLFSDSTWSTMFRLKCVNCHFNTISPFLALNVATRIGNWNLSNNHFAGGFSLAPSAQMDFVNLSNNFFLGAVSITGISSSTYNSTGNTIAGGLTYAGNFAILVSVGDILSSGSFTLTATGTGPQWLKINGSSFASGPWTPVLTPASGSYTYSRQAGWYEIQGSVITVLFSIIVNGSSTPSGSIKLTGLPYACTSRASGAGSGGALANTANLTGTFTGPMIALADAGNTTAGLIAYTAAGPGNFNATQGSNTMAISGVFSYEWQ